MSTLTLTAPHQVTLNLTGLPRGPLTTQWAAVPPFTTGANGWSVVTAGQGTINADASDGITATVTAASAVFRRTFTAVAGSVYRRVRLKMVLLDPESRPVKVAITTPLNGTSRMVSGVPVWLEGVGSANGTVVEFTVTKPVGAASASVLITAAEVTTEDAGAESWTLTRTDSNGVREMTEVRGLRAPAGGGALVVVDREASLTGNVSYRLLSSFLSIDETLNTGATGVLSTGYGVLHRISTPAGTMHQVNVIEFSGSYQGQAQPLPILGSDTAAVPVMPLASREGRLTLYFPTLDAAELVAADLRTGEVHMLRQDADTRTSMDAYLIATSLTVERVLTELPEPLWTLMATYVETARGL